MNRIVTICAAGISAITLLGAAPAVAQPYIYGDGYYGGGYDAPPPPPRYLGAGPYGYPPPYRGYVEYRPHREVFVGPNGEVYRRCRPHRACYNPPDY